MSDVTCTTLYEILLCIYHMKTLSVLTCVSGKLLSDVALCFSQMRLFSEASECYEQALPLVSSKPHRLAVVLQNLGAVYNSLGQYQQSLRYHREAAALHGETHTPQTRNTCPCACGWPILLPGINMHAVCCAHIN